MFSEKYLSSGSVLRLLSLLSATTKACHTVCLLINTFCV